MDDSSLLTAVEARVLGCLLEKETTTPEYYPMSLHALAGACNQRSNRDPVVEWDEGTVERGLEGLRRRRLAVMMHLAGSRVPKYKHVLDSVYGNVDDSMKAVLCELLLRNVQTPGELRARTERLHPIADLPALEAVVERLVHYGSGPLAVVLPPGGGRRVRAVAHLMCGPVEEEAAPPAKSAAAPRLGDWREELEAKVGALQAEVAALRETVDQLKSQLD